MNFVARVIIALGAMIAMSLPGSAHDPSGKNQYSEWFTSQLQPNGMQFCCGDMADQGGDAHYVDVKQSGDSYYVKIDGMWTQYPHDVNPNQPNPTGRNVAWYKFDRDGKLVFYCLRLSTGI